MRALVLGSFILSIMIHPSFGSSAIQPKKLDEVQAPVPAGHPHQWQGRRHFLFDDSYPAGSRTDGSGPSDDDCAPAQLRRTDGVRVTRPSPCER
jgi:hypothetical protein